MITLPITCDSESKQYDICIGSGILNGIANILSGNSFSGRSFIISNDRVFSLYGKQLVKALCGFGAAPTIVLIGEGEKIKNLRTVTKILGELSRNGASRKDTLFALGGGIVGDVAGFAAAIHLRGIRFVQVPTTLLSMIDSSVGGKTGVNSDFGKNLIGAFYQPDLVVTDTETLGTLPRRELTAGFCEAVKQGIIAGGTLFETTRAVLEKHDLGKPFAFADKFGEDISKLIAEQVAFKAKVVSNDPKEDLSRTDGSSRKILNFGHTFGHALEKSTDFRKFKHGEAVGHGILFAAELSKSIDFIDQEQVELIYGLVSRVGKIPSLKNVPIDQTVSALAFDKKRIGKKGQWVLLKDIGKPVIINQDEIPSGVFESTVKRFFEKQS